MVQTGQIASSFLLPSGFFSQPCSVAFNLLIELWRVTCTGKTAGNGDLFKCIVMYDNMPINRMCFKSTF